MKKYCSSIIGLLSLILACGCQNRSDATSAPKEPLTGQIVVAPTTAAWLARETGEPFFMCGAGDPENFLYRGERRPDGTRRGDQEYIISKLSKSGVNGIYFQAIRSHGGDGGFDHNPFIDSDPRKGLDPNILQQWDEWITALEMAGVVSFFFIYDDSARIWDTGNNVGRSEREFLTNLVNHFEHHPLLTWVIAEEYEERYTSKRISNIAKIIREADDHNHVIAVHKLTSLEFDEFADDPYIDQFAIQFRGSSEELHDGIVAAWNHANGRYNLNMSEAAKHGTGETARIKNWSVAMGGAYIMVYKMDVANTSSRDLEDCGRLARFMEMTDFQNMRPADELALRSTQYVLANPGMSYIAYTKNNDGVMGIRGLTSGNYSLTWFDAMDGDLEKTDTLVTEPNSAWVVPDIIGAEAAVYVLRSQR